MIKSIKIKNFKNIKDQSIELERLTVFVGANGSGKTSVLDAVLCAAHPGEHHPANFLANDRHPDWLYMRGGAGDLSVECKTETGSFSILATPPVNDFPPSSPDLIGQSNWNIPRIYESDPVIKETGPVVFLDLDARKLAQPSYPDKVVPQISSDGKGLASVLAYMRLNDTNAAFSTVLKHMQWLFPRLKEIRFKKTPISLMHQFSSVQNSIIGEALLFDFENATNVSAKTVSQGTLIVLGLLTVLLGPGHPKVVLMDDIEHGLHPLAQKMLLEVLAKLMESFPNLQIIATAHSPYLLDYLKPEQIRLMALNTEGHAICGRLQDHPEFEKWKGEMTPGELWSLFGEKWLTQKGVA